MLGKLCFITIIYCISTHIVKNVLSLLLKDPEQGVLTRHVLMEWCHLPGLDLVLPSTRPLINLFKY